VESSSRRAYEIATDIGDPDLLSRATYALGSFYEIRGDHEKSDELVNQHLELQSELEGEGRVDSYELLACSLFHQGMFESSLSNAERGVGLYNPQHHNPLAAYGDHPGVACHDWAALSLWFLGYPDEALARAREAMTLAEDPYNFYSLANARVQFAIVHQFRREPVPCEQWADATVSLSGRYGYAYRTAMGMIVSGWARAAQGRTDEGIASIMEGLDVARGTGAEMDHAYFLGLQAEAHLFAGNAQQTAATVADALGQMPRGRTFFFEAELHRLRGRAALAASGDTALAEKAYRTALDVAKAQKARSLQLRALIALAGLESGSDGTDPTLAELNVVYNKFNDGLDTPDLVEAHALLESHIKTA
jgi:predicted ATPase